MERLVWFSSIISVCLGSILKDSVEYYREGSQIFTFPGDGDNRLHLVDITDPVDRDVINAYTREPNNNGYWLYTRSHPTKPVFLFYNDANSIKNSDLNINKTTVFLVHGWLGNGENDMNKLLTEAFLENSDVNVIVFDWSNIAGRNYLTAKNGVFGVGKSLGIFIEWLWTLGVRYDKVHLVGFSLGAHVVGSAGRSLGSQIKRITGLDPAGPLWDRDENRLNKTDAKYVEIIHTNTNMYGYNKPCGHADFYPNGGASMPGCWINVCSHRKGYEYMAVSVKYNHLYANECHSLTDVSRNRCNGDLYPMGNNDLNKSRSGIFRVNIK